MLLEVRRRLFELRHRCEDSSEECVAAAAFLLFQSLRRGSLRLERSVLWTIMDISACAIPSGACNWCRVLGNATSTLAVILGQLARSKEAYNDV